jgi:hypothetical protein
VRRLRPRTALVGRIDPDAPDAVSSVSGYDAKLGVVDENTRVIVPRADYRTAVAANHKYGDSAQLIPVTTWRQAAREGRAIDRKRLLTLAVVGLFIFGSATFGLYQRSEARRDAAAQAAAADAAARALLQRQTGSTWERLQLDVRAYRTRDGLDTRDRMRAWARQLQFAQVLVPIPEINHAWFVDEVVNADGSAAITPHPTLLNQLIAWDLTTSPPKKFTVTADGTGQRAAAWVGRNVVAVSRAQGTTVLWNVRTQQPLRELEVSGDELVSDPTGRWLGYGSAQADEFQVLNLESGTIDTVALPAPLQPRGTQLEERPRAMVEGILTTGELVVAYSEGVVALSRAGSRPLDQRAYLNPVVDLGHGQLVVATETDDGYELFGLETSTVLATWEPPEGTNWNSVAFTPGLIRAVFVGDAPTPRGQSESYVVVEGGTDAEPVRHIEIPIGYRLIRAAAEESGGYRLVLDEGDGLLVLRVPPPDAMERALIQAQDAVVTNDGRHLVLRGPSDKVEVWDIGARKLVGDVPSGSAEFSQHEVTGSLVISPDSDLLVTVFHDRPAKVWRLPDLQPLGDIPLPTASESFIDTVEEAEIGAIVSFVTERLVLVVYGDGVSTWSLDPLTKRTETQIPLPAAAMPGERRVVLPDHEQLLTVRGTHVQRNRLSDGVLVTGSAFNLGDLPSRGIFHDLWPAVDPDGSLMAVFYGGGVEIWDLLEHRRVDRLPLGDHVTVDHMKFVGGTDELEVVLMDDRAKNATGILTLRWHRSSGFDVLTWLGLTENGIEQIPDSIPPLIFAWPGPDGALETAAPQAWLDRICRTLPDLQYEAPLGLPDAAWSGHVCANR